MALVKGETRGGLNNPQPPVKTKPVVPPKSPGAIKTSVEPAAPNFADEKPVPALQAHGFSGGISEFNHRVQTVHDSYQAAYGVQPSPGLIFDLAKSPVQTTDFPKMFTVPLSQQQAKARAANITHGAGVPAPAVNAAQVATQIMDAAKTGDYHGYLETNAALIHQVSQGSKADAAKIAGAVFNAKRLATTRSIEEQVNNGTLSAGEGRAQLQAAGFIPGGSAFHALKGVGGELALGIGQVTDNLVHSPAGLYLLGRAIGLDTRQLVFDPAKLAHLESGLATGNLKDIRKGAPRTSAIAAATVKGYKRDIQDPVHNPGNLFLDALGFASVGAGAVARTAEAGRLLTAGEGAGAAAKALTRRAPLKRAVLNHGGFTEEMPLSQNPLVAAAQKFVIDSREKGAAKKLEQTDTPSGLKFVLAPQVARDFLENNVARSFLEENLSFPKKLGREADARKRVDHTVQMTLSRELDHVAGRAVMQSRMFAKVPSKLRGAMTRGEQKAIQVLSWDDPDPLAAERQFHERMIDMGIGDPKEHRRQIADLKLAKAVLDKPSPRFKQALALTRQVVADMEETKIRDLGLLPETAEGRVAKAGAVLRGDTTVVGRTPAVIQGEINKLTGLLQAKHSDVAAQARVAPYGEGGVRGKLAKLQAELAEAKSSLVPSERVSGESFYLPTQRRGKVKRQPSDKPGYYPTKAGPFGIPLGQNLSELTHEFTGKALQAGDIRIDATSLATEAYGRTVRAATVRNEHAKLWDAAHETPRSRYDVPIRDSNTIPDKLREVVARLDEGDFGPADAEMLPADMRDLITELYPDPRKLTQEQINGVKWVDARLLGEGTKLPHVPGLGAEVAQAVNAPIRFTMLYLRPAYILNKLGNHAMGVLDQGWAWPGSFVKAMSAESRYGAENARTIRELVGAGRSESYVTSSSGRISKSVADFWARVADRDERVASFVYYMERKGYKTKDQVDALLHDRANRADLTEITRRGNKALVEFDNLTPIEKNYIRHWVFVYPWVSRSAVWSIRTILDHPARVSILDRLGQQDLETDKIFSKAPEWFKRIGYIPVGWNSDGTPRVVNPTSINTFSTLGDFLAMGRAATQGDKYASAADFLGPLPTYFVHAATGRDEFGNQYPGSQWLGAAKEVLAGLPQVAAYEKAGKTKAGTAQGMKLGDRSSLEASLNANLKKTVMSPGWLDGYGSLIVGGLSPKSVNMDSLEARYWADQDPKVRHARELDLLNRALKIQGDALGRPVPKAVKSAVADQANLDYAYKQFLKQSGRAPTDKERAGFTIDYLKQQNLISTGQASKFHAALKPLADPSDIARLKGALLDRFANGVALRQWDTDVRQIASLTPAIFNQKAAELFKQGLVPQRQYQVPQEKLYDYGRKYVQFTHDAQALKQKVTDGTATEADLKAFQDANDKPVDGLPSFIRFAWSQTPPDQQQQTIASNVTASWSSLTAFDKALLGRPSDAKVTSGWAKLKDIVGAQRAALKREGRGFPAGYERTLAKYVERYYDAPGLVKDYDFSKQPLFQRMKYLGPIQQSPNKNLWSQVLNQAAQIHKYLSQKDDQNRHTYNVTQVRQMWTDYVSSPQFQAWLGEHPSFKTEIGSYGKSVLASLVS